MLDDTDRIASPAATRSDDVATVDGLAVLADPELDDFTRSVRTRAALASLPRPTALLGCDGVVLDVNEALIACVGTERDELADRRLPSFPWWTGRPTARARVADLVDRAAAGEAGARVVAASRVDGGAIPVQVSLSPIRDARNQVVLLRAEVEQLTDAKRTIGLLDQRNQDVAGAEARFRVLTEHSRDLLCRHTPDGRFIEVGGGSTHMLGIGPDELAGSHPRSLVHPDDRTRLAEMFDRFALPDPASHLPDPGARSLRFRRHDGDYLLMRLVVSPVYDADGNVVEFVSVAHPAGDATGFAGSTAALHDSLTGLPTRALFIDRLEQALAASRRTVQPVAVMSIDLAGHGMHSSPADWADATLVGIGRRLRALVRPGDTLARVGFDDFAMLCVGIDGPAGAQAVALRLLNSLHDPFEIDGARVQLRPSIGLACSIGDDPADDVLDQAAAARQGASAKPGPRVATYDPSHHREIPRRSTSLAIDLRAAIAAQALVVHYQPELDLRTGALAGFEALVRWPVATGLLPPGEFVHVAEETGLIVDLGRLVLNAACQQARTWRERSGRPVPVWVNLSGRQLGHPDLVSDIVASTIDAGITPDLLAFEITESVLVHDTPTVVDQLAELRNRGFRLAIDDFGTGYSSLAYLNRFPLDVLKLDRAFISNLGCSSDNAGSHVDMSDGGTRLVAGIIELAHSLDLTVIAEGIERTEQLLALRELHCDQALGYLLGAPAAASTFDTLVAEGRSADLTVPA